MKLSLIVAPSDSGHQHSGFGRGPDAILGAGLVEMLEDAGHEVTVEDIGKVGDIQTREIATGFAVCRAVAVKVAEARDEDRFPIVLTGNCLTANGAVAGERADAIVWFDQAYEDNEGRPLPGPVGTFILGFVFAMMLQLSAKSVLGAAWMWTKR